MEKFVPEIQTPHKQKQRKTLFLATAISVVGIACLITGIILVVKRNSSRCEAAPNVQKWQGEKTTVGLRCGYSKEAKRAGLVAFLQRVQYETFEVQPFLIALKPKVSASEVLQKYKVYDPSPSTLKTVTDTAKSLLEDLNRMAIEEKKLKSRERKVLAQLRHYLKHVFGTPFDGDYYFGDFLLGPNVFCWQPICTVGVTLEKSLPFFKPSDTRGLEILIEKLAEVNETFQTYTDNLRYGVKAGMVRSIEECRSGIDAVRRTYYHIAFYGPKGVFNESYMRAILKPEFLSNLENKTDQLDEWERNHEGKTVFQSLRESVLENVGRPIHAFLRYLENDHLQHCVPSKVSSGLSFLPVSFVYVNGSANVTQKTTKVLPTGEPLNGTKAYIDILSYFTTTNNTPDEVHELGYKMLYKLFPEALEVARQVTGENDNHAAKVEFLKMMNSSEMFFSNGSIPPRESGKDAFKLCSSAEKAKQHCPQRWQAIQRWFTETREVMSMLDPKTSQMFYFTGKNHTTPNCPLEMVADFNPSAGVPSYRSSDKACSRNAKYFIPFFLERPGPRYMQWSINAHEARPGHHTQAQGYQEHFQDTCGGEIAWVSSMTSYTAFSEGWALYAENPLIAYDTDTYEGQPLYKYGMLKSQLWRALRMIVDTGLHYKGLRRDEALHMFQKYLWDDSDIALKEVTRYQSVPGQATAYMIGQMHIIKLREYAQEKLGKAFNLKDFHLQLLYQGSAPLSFLEESIKEYVDCALNKNKEGCEEILSPLTKDTEDIDSKNDDLATMDMPERQLYF